MYAKVFSSLWDGTLYGKADAQLVFIFMLARCNQDGFIRVVPEAIAGPTGLSLESVAAALEFLEAPDPDSGSPEEDGCRIVRVAAGTWTITNYSKYRNMRDADTVRSQTSERVSRYRNAQKRSVTLGNALKRQAEAEVEVEVDVDVEAEAEAEAKTDAEARKGVCVEPKGSPPSPVFLTLPTNRQGETWPVTEAMLANWSELYPGVDVRQGIRSMRGWLDANPEKRKTLRGLPRFANRWLAKEQDNGGQHRSNGRGLSAAQIMSMADQMED